MNGKLQDFPEGSARWCILEDRVAIEDSSGNVSSASAVQIVGAEYKDRFSIDGLQVCCRPSEALADLNFHRFPLTVTLAIRPAKKDSYARARCVLSLSARKKEFVVEIFPEPEDQYIADDSWYPIAPGAIGEIRALMHDVGISNFGDISLRQYLDLLKIKNEWIEFDPNLTQINRDFIKPVPDALPPNFVGQLYDYQLNGFGFLSEVAREGIGCILGDEMGLGKTVQIVVLLLAQKEQGFGPSLVLAPATLLENWRREFEKFGPSLDVEVHRGPDRTGFPSELSSADIVVSSYDTASRDLALLKMIDWNILVLDEAQAIKNPGTMRSTSVKQIPKRVGIAVTGTPIENRLRDLWSIMDFACPGLLGSESDFERHFEDTDFDAAELERIVTPLLLRRRVSEVAKDLPERIDIPQAVLLSDSAARKYESLRLSIFNEYGASASLVALTKLRQFCSHPFVVEGYSAGDPLIYSSKYERLVELLEEITASREKVIIFCSFTTMADILVNDLPRRFGIYCRFIDGRTPVEDRQEIVDEFSELTEPGALILNPRAAGTGLNITAANHVIHYNLEWNPAVEDQASARAYRRGQARPVTVHRLYHPGTIEEIIDDRLKRKRDLADIAIVGHEGRSEHADDIAKAIEISPLI